MRQRVMTGCAIAVTMLLGLVIAGAQQPQPVLVDPEFGARLRALHDQEIKSITGLNSMSVVVDQLDPDLFRTEKRKGEDIRNRTETLLRNEKIQILNEKELGQTAGQPFLKIKVNFDSKTSPYSGLVKVALTQLVVLHTQLRGQPVSPGNPKDTRWSVQLDTKNLLYAETWHTQRCFKVSSLNDIDNEVAKVVEQFTHDYREAQVKP